MTKATASFPLEEFRGYLLMLARARWGDLLQARGTCSDLAHDALCDAQEDLETFEGTSVEEFKAWLRKIFDNTLKDWIKYITAQIRNPAREIPIDVALAGASPGCTCFATRRDRSPSSAVAAVEQKNCLLNAIRQLPQKQQQAVYLSYFEDLSRAEIAARLGVTDTAVAGLLARARETLGELMGGRG